MENTVNVLPDGRIIKKGKILFSEISIKAKPDRVWTVLTDFTSYPLWNPFIKAVNGIPETGKQIEVSIQPPGEKAMVFSPVVLVYDKAKEFRWIGKLGFSHLFDGEHAFILQENREGNTDFIQMERFRGILVPFLKGMLDTNTLSGFQAMNEALKKRCEE
jgi:hypothetical protein